MYTYIHMLLEIFLPLIFIYNVIIFLDLFLIYLSFDQVFNLHLSDVFYNFEDCVVNLMI